MNHLDTSDRKNVTLLGEDDLSKVVGGYGGHWHRKSGGGHKNNGNGMRKRGYGAGMRQRGSQGGGGNTPIVINVFIIDELNIAIQNGR